MQITRDAGAVSSTRWPDAGGDLRGRWDVRYEDRNAVELDDRLLAEILAAGNLDQPQAVPRGRSAPYLSAEAR